MDVPSVGSASEISANGPGPVALTKSPRSNGQPKQTEFDESRQGAPVGWFDRWLVNKLLRAVGDPALSFVLWNAESITTSPQAPIGRILIPDRSTLLKMVVNLNVAFGDGYTAGRIQVEGDLAACAEIVYRAAMRTAGKESLGGRLWRRLSRRKPNTLARSRDNIHHHYNIGNDFYKLWLDEQLVYTCGYYNPADASLEDAQVAKMDYVCRKARLKPGDAVVEAGCGWGALALHMARKYGTTVKAYNVSHEQIMYARERARAEGLSERVQFIEDDWRKISGRCDAFVSVGMLEHVGRENYRDLGDVIHRCLKPSGFGLIHTIGRNAPQPLNGWISKRIFPGACPPSLKEMTDIFQRWNYSVLDLENIRLHYAKTLEHWLERFDQHAHQIAEMFDDRFVRMWRLYLSGSIAAFRSGRMQLFQVVFTDGRNNAIPWTRTHMFAE